MSECVEPTCDFIAEPGTGFCPFHQVQSTPRVQSPTTRDSAGNNMTNNYPSEGASE